MEPTWLSEAVMLGCSAAGLTGLWLRLRAHVQLDQTRQRTRTEMLRTLPPGSRLSDHGADGSLVQIDVGPTPSGERG